MNNCVFCKIRDKEIPAHILYEDDKVMAFLDAFPITLGHALIIPKKHFANIYDIEEEYLVEVIKLSQKIANILDKGKIAHLTTPAGTDLTMNIEGRIAEADTGLNDFTGAFSNLPAGEAYVSPKEGTSQGTLVIDGAMGGIGVLTEPIKMTVKNGLVTNIFGNEQAEKLQKLLSAHGKDAFNIAELGVGTNDKAIITGKILEDEKVLGTVHVALGNNIGFGGNVSVPIHLDGILMNPTLKVDGKIIIKDGMQLL